MIIIDFETYSPESIDNGAVKYACHPDTNIICLGYKIDDDPAQLWLPGRPMPDFSGHRLYAHNALFDFLIWHVPGAKYNFPGIEPDNWEDTMALANRYTFPNELAEIGKILKLPVQKNPRGKALIKKICIPVHGRRPIPGQDFTYAELEEFYAYCVQDVETTYKLVKALPSDRLNDQEHTYWQIVQKMNLRGLPIDKSICEKILSYIEGYAQDMSLRVSEITGGAVEKATQVQRIVKWINTRGVKVNNLQAETVEVLLEEEELPVDVKEMLELRQALGRSSTAKFRKMIDTEYAGRTHCSMQYYGAQKTGRIAGRGIQIHNLPRASVDAPEEIIEKFDNFEPVEDPVRVAKALIRPMIRAELGFQLLVSDYSSIENCILMWYADEKEVLTSIKAGEDQYKVMAKEIYGLPVTEIGKDSFERLVGKIAVLGCGFGMGPDKFVEDARKKWKVKFQLHEGEVIVKAWRRKHALTVKLWYAWKDCVVSAINNPGQVYTRNKVNFKVVKDRNGNKWLIVTLASSRSLYYFQPYLDTDRYGVVPGHYGMNPYSKQWTRLALIPGRITENIVQATARDIMMLGLQNVDEEMPEARLLASVHDEALSEIKEIDIREDTLEGYNSLLCKMPPWADGLPLKANGWIGPRYKK